MRVGIAGCVPADALPDCRREARRGEAGAPAAQGLRVAETYSKYGAGPHGRRGGTAYTCLQMTNQELTDIDAYWRAANYLTVGQIYLQDNVLLREPLQAKHIKPRLLGHWGTSPGLSLVYVHVNQAIRARDLNAIYLAGPGHGGPAVLANVYLEGTYSEIYPNITEDAAGMRVLFRQFSTPGGRAEPREPADPRLDPRGW